MLGQTAATPRLVSSTWVGRTFWPIGVLPGEGLKCVLGSPVFVRCELVRVGRMGTEDTTEG